MSYNIDRWKTKRLVDLVIPLIAYTSAYTADRISRGWRPNIQHDYATNKITIGMGCDSDEAIVGTLTADNLIHVESISLRGEGSGTDYYDVLIPMLKASHGELEAVQVWEGGDSISRLVVKDGVVTETPVEL